MIKNKDVNIIFVIRDLEQKVPAITWDLNRTTIFICSPGVVNQID
jgi:hypothetical protein